MAHSTCGQMFNAGKTLLEQSGLVVWTADGDFGSKYPGLNDCQFEKCAAKRFGGEFGRYISWVMFSVGAENLAKAACVCNGIVSKSPPNLDYGTLGDYWKGRPKETPYLKQLCEKRSVLYTDSANLLNGYRYLTQKIRNRDTHTYIPNVRRNDFPKVELTFVPAFNILVETMKKNGHFGGSNHA